MSPVALGGKIPHIHLLLQPQSDTSHRPRHLPGNERLAPQRRLMIEQDTVGRMHMIRLPIIHRNPITIQLRDSIRAPRIERCRLLLGYLLHQAIQLGSRRLIDTCLGYQVQQANCLQDTQHAQRIRVRRILRRIKTHLHMAHRRQVINLVRLNLADDTRQVQAIRQVPIVQDQIPVLHMRILIQMIDTIRIEHGRTPFDTMHRISFLNQELGKIRPVLSRYTRD